MKTQQLILACLVFICLVLTGVVFHELRGIMLPFVIAILLSNLFAPLAQYLKNHKVPTAVSLLLVLVIFAAVVTGFGFVLYASIDSMIAQADKYQARIIEISQGLAGQVGHWQQQFGIPVENLDWKKMIKFEEVAGQVTSGLGSFIIFAENTFIIVMCMMFILAGSGQLTEKVRHGFSPDWANKIGKVLENSDSQIRRYLLYKTLINLSIGIITTLILWALGVDFPLFWGLVAFLTHYIPNIGAIVATVLPFLLSLLQFDTFTTPILVLILLGCVHFGVGHILEPRLFADRLNLSALLVLVALFFWGWLWGIGGMLLAVPLTSVMKILIENISQLQPLAMLMSDEVKKPSLADFPIGGKGNEDIP